MNRFNKEMPAAKKQAIADEILEMTLKYPNLDVDLICATITHESDRSWNPKIVSKAGAMGLMQIMPRTVSGLRDSKELSGPQPKQFCSIQFIISGWAHATFPD